MTDHEGSELAAGDVIVPVRSSGASELEAVRIPIDELRHGRDDQGRFVAAYSNPGLFAEFGPPNSDWIRLPLRELASRADGAGERVVVDAGSPGQREIPREVLAALAAGAVRGGREAPVPAVSGASTPLRRLARDSGRQGVPLEAPDEVPANLATALSGALAELRQVEVAWLLRRGEGWTIGIQLDRAAGLAEFDEVRNRLHAVGTDQLGTRRLLAVTDLRAPSLRDEYSSVADPFYERDRSPGLLDRLFGRS